LITDVQPPGKKGQIICVLKKLRGRRKGLVRPRKNNKPKKEISVRGKGIFEFGSEYS